MKQITLSFLLVAFTATFALAQSANQHTVRRGETFALIAKQHGISETELKNANPGKNSCYAGLKLTIPKPGQSIVSAQATSNKTRALSDKFYISDSYDHFSAEVQDEANKGNVMAMKELADCYHWGVPFADDIPAKKDVKQALSLYERADSANYPFAQIELAHMYNSGDGVKRDAAKASELYSKAFSNFAEYANDGDAKAMTHLGNLCFSPSLPGNAERADYDEGIYWYRMAVKSGDVNAAAQLANIYRRGVGVEKDEKEALKWDARFCIDAEKKGWFVEDFVAYNNLQKAGIKTSDSWAATAKDTYDEIVKPVKPQPKVEIEEATAAASTKPGSGGTASKALNANKVSNQSASSNKTANNGKATKSVSSEGNKTTNGKWFEVHNVDCSKCYGSGEMRCTKCYGSGVQACTIKYMRTINLFQYDFYHPANCNVCHNTGQINCFQCQGKRTMKCDYCLGLKTLKNIKITQALQSAQPHPSYGVMPVQTRLEYMTPYQTLTNYRNIKSVYIYDYMKCNIDGMRGTAVDNGDTWMIVPDDNNSVWSKHQHYLSKDYSTLFVGGDVYILAAPDVLAAQKQLNSQALARLQGMAMSMYGSPSTSSSQSEVAKSLQEEVDAIERRQAARARQELSDAKLNVTLQQTHREVYCDHCKSWGLKHTHFR